MIGLRRFTGRGSKRFKSIRKLLLAIALRGQRRALSLPFIRVALRQPEPLRMGASHFLRVFDCNLGVAQICNLPYRGIVFRNCPPCRQPMDIRRFADCKSAIQQITNLRYTADGSHADTRSFPTAAERGPTRRSATSSTLWMRLPGKFSLACSV